MGSRSFNAWPSVEAILNSIGDGRSAWRHKTLPAVVTEAERHGVPVVNRAWNSKSKFVNEAILFYSKQRGEQLISFADLLKNIEGLQNQLARQYEEMEELRRAKGRVSLWRRIFG